MFKRGILLLAVVSMVILSAADSTTAAAKKRYTFPAKAQAYIPSITVAQPTVIDPRSTVPFASAPQCEVPPGAVSVVPLVQGNDIISDIGAGGWTCPGGTVQGVAIGVNFTVSEQSDEVRKTVPTMSKASLEADPTGGIDPGSVVVSTVPVAPGLKTTMYTWTLSAAPIAEVGLPPGQEQQKTGFIVASAEPSPHLFLAVTVFATAGASEAQHWLLDMLKTGAKAPGATPALKS